MRVLITSLIVFFSIAVSAQDQPIQDDELEETILEEIVVTGQYNPQAVNKSIYEVKVISREMIDKQAGNNLADVLNQSLNLNIRPSNSTGKSGVEMFGLDSQYFKILVDNIPLLNDEGLGNNTDLTQINLDDIERIEIVEGSMGVEYGANAIAGIINVITKKSSVHKWQISPSIHEETIGDEYNLNTKGRHIQSLKIGHQIREDLYANVTFSRNDFKGYWNDHLGKTHLLDDNLRGYDWLPKIQNSVKFVLNFKKENYRLYYKFDFFDESTSKYNERVLVNAQPETQTSQPTANDQIFNTQRFYHHLNASGNLKELFNYDVSFSFQKQVRSVENYQYRIRLDEKFNTQNFDYESRDGFYSKGLFSNFLNSEKIDFQLGYEMSEINGFASSISGDFNAENISKRLGSYDVFGSTEINVNSKFSFRPGVRVMFSSQFDTQQAISLSTKYSFTKDFDIRLIAGTSPRVPNYDELYSYFVDVNHNVQGNANLNPENGKSAFIHLRKKHNFNTIQSESKLSGWLIDVSDRIELIIVNSMPLEYKFMNIDTYKTRGVSYNNHLKYNDFSGNIGITYAGMAKEMTENNGGDDFLYAMQFNLNGSYTFPKTKTTISAFYKYNGSMYQYIQSTDIAQNVSFVKGKREAFSWLDASVKQNFLSDKLEVTLGARNLLNVVDVSSNIEQSDAHTVGSGNLNLGYGRSFFFKLVYNLNI